MPGLAEEDASPVCGGVGRTDTSTRAKLVRVPVRVLIRVLVRIRVLVLVLVLILVRVLVLVLPAQAIVECRPALPQD